MQAILNNEIANSTASWATTPRTAVVMADWLALRRAGGYPVLVAIAGGEVCGYAGAGPFRAGEGYARTTEHSVYVSARHRRLGIARALLAALVEATGKAGFRLMVGGVSADQEASIGLHRALGFREVGRIPGAGEKFGRRLDLVFMARDLVAPA